MDVWQPYTGMVALFPSRSLWSFCSCSTETQGEPGTKSHMTQHDVIDKWQQKGGVSCVAKQVHVYHLVCMTVTLAG